MIHIGSSVQVIIFFTFDNVLCFLIFLTFISINLVENLFYVIMPNNCFILLSYFYELMHYFSRTKIII